MSEIPVRSPVPAEVATTRRWIEEFVIGKAVCPPLVYLARKHQLADGGVNWDAIKDKVQIESYFGENPSLLTLPEKVADSYYKFIKFCVGGGKILSKIFILPDFGSNRDYDTFVYKMKGIAIARLGTVEGKKLVRSAVKQIGMQKGRTNGEIKSATSTSLDMMLSTEQVTDVIFGPAYFYGRRVEFEDLANFSDKRGVRLRHRVLTRAPHYMIQMVNSLDKAGLDDRLDINKLNARNTKLALETNVDAHESRMAAFRAANE